jgi:dTDP-4-amino-4,6-dideoxygalactose transaminase
VLAERRRLAHELKRRLHRAPLAYQEQSERSTWQYFQTLAPSAAARDAVAVRAVELGVEMRTLHDPALLRQPAFAAAARHGDLAVTDDLAARSLSLPLANSLTDPELDRIAAVAHRAQETPA